MRDRVYRFAVFIALSVLLAACVAPPAAAPAASVAGSAAADASANTLVAVKVAEVALDGNAAFWADAPKLTTPTQANHEGVPDGPDVTLQAAYDDNNIVLRAEWADSTENRLKAAWTWDGSAFTKSGDEDRLQLAFPITNDPDFASKGCAALCHNMADDPEQWYMATDSEDARIDGWHWKSTRTDPVGQADDQWWHTQSDPADVESGRSSDAKDSGGYADNVNEDRSGPAFMHAGDPASAYILGGDEVPVDTAQLAAGAVIPGYVLSPFVGSRGDVTAQGQWSDGKWVVVLMRGLETGHDDDVVFTPPKPYPFGLSVTDNGGGYDHTNAPEVLTLTWR